MQEARLVDLLAGRCDAGGPGSSGRLRRPPYGGGLSGGEPGRLNQNSMMCGSDWPAGGRGATLTVRVRCLWALYTTGPVRGPSAGDSQLVAVPSLSRSAGSPPSTGSPPRRPPGA